jgi:ferredoxin
MKITIGDACTGHGVCESLRPDLFEVGDDGVAHLLTEDVTEADRKDLEYAVAQCPTRALELEG